jgi:putative ABC transport system permease protein
MGHFLRAGFLLRVAFRNLGRTPRRTAVSVIAIATAVCAFLLFDSFVQGVKVRFRSNLITSNYAHFQLMKDGYRENKGHDPFGYQISDIETIRNTLTKEVGSLTLFSARQSFYGLLSKDDRTISARGIGIDARAEAAFFTNNRVTQGTHLEENISEGIFVGEGLAKQAGVKAGDAITVLTNTISGSLNALDLIVTGTFKTGVHELDDVVFYIDRTVAAKLLRTNSGSQILLGFPMDREMEFSTVLRTTVAKHFPDLRVYHWHDLAGEYFDNSMGWLESQFHVFRVIILIIASLSIINVFTVSLLERTGEFGTLRAIGTQRREIAGLILVESVLQSIVGGIAGLAMGILLIRYGLASGISMPPPPGMSTSFHVAFGVPWSGLPVTLLLCIGVAGGAGIFPALKIARLNIVQALGRNV